MAESDDDRELARAAILQRRSRLIAYAVAVGACAPACGGVCLSPAAPNSGGDGGVGAMYGCLSGAPPVSAGEGGVGDTGSFYPCLSGAGPSAGGEGGVPSGIIIPTAAGESAGGEGGAGGPFVCLSVK